MEDRSWSVTATAAPGSAARGKLSPCCSFLCSPRPYGSTQSTGGAGGGLLEWLCPRGSPLLELQRGKHPEKGGPRLGVEAGGLPGRAVCCLWGNEMELQCFPLAKGSVHNCFVPFGCRAPIWCLRAAEGLCEAAVQMRAAMLSSCNGRRAELLSTFWRPCICPADGLYVVWVPIKPWVHQQDRGSGMGWTW